MTTIQFFSILGFLVEYAIKLVAIGLVPENRRPSSSTAWLLLILMIPAVGFPLYWLLGSPYVKGRRQKLQNEATALLTDRLSYLKTVPAGVEPSAELASVLEMNRRLTGLPCVTGVTEGLYGDTDEAYAAMAAAVREARDYVYVEFYIMAWDETTDDFFVSLAEAVQRGVSVRLLLDHIGSRKYPGWKQFKQRLTDAGIQWHLMMPIDPLRRRWRRPDLRNHRKLLVVDGEVAFIGSHNVIDPSYGSARNVRLGRAWKDLSLKVTGQIVPSIEVVFGTDWYAETGEVLPPHPTDTHAGHVEGGATNAMQIVPSGPGFPSEPNLRMFSTLINQATRNISITSPYFVPDESLLSAITSAAYRGVRVDLFVGEEADQFIVGHAQRSYYTVLLEAGVHIHLYPRPKVLHSKYLTIDDSIGMIGSSNLDYRSFALDYEITLLAFGGDLVDQLVTNDLEYLAISHELTMDEWRKQPWQKRYLDNVCRLTSAVM